MSINLTLASVKDIAQAVTQGHITREQALARCDSVIAREPADSRKAKRWTALRTQIVGGGAVSHETAFAVAYSDIARKPATPKVAVPSAAALGRMKKADLVAALLALASK